jgi:pimeloyl-ACP methyl ester carboxylesterase
MSRASIVSRIVHRAHNDAPQISFERPWWRDLPAGFWREEEAFDLGLVDRAKIGATAGIDVAIRTAAAMLVGTLAAPGGYHPGRLRTLRRDLDFYTPFADSRDPHRFFAPPPSRVPVERRRVRFAAFRPKDGGVEDLRFVSPFEPVNPRLRGHYTRMRGGNHIAHARYWHHGDGPRRTIIAIHGFSADLSLLNEWVFALPWLYRLGCDVLLFTLPFHGKRQTRFSPFSGHGFFAGGLARLNEAFAQAVFDFRILLDHLESRGVTNPGIMGVSLGGYTAALLAAIEPRLQFVIANVPLVSVVDLVLEWHPISALVWGALKATGVRLEDIRHILAVHSPLTYRPIVPKERRFIVGGAADRLAPPKHSRLLWEHWERCKIHWFPGSHLVHLDRGDYLRRIRDFLRGIDFLPIA